MDAPELKPCPFCGEALFTKAADSRSDLLSVHHPSSDCLLSGESWWLVPRFTAAWNRRADPALLAEAVERIGQARLLLDTSAISMSETFDYQPATILHILSELDAALAKLEARHDR